MERNNTRGRKAVHTAMALALLAGTVGQAGLSSAGASATAERGDEQTDKRIAKLEAQVAKSPRNASARVQLAQAYLTAGRFQSAATTFEDAVSLGDSDARIGLGQALAYIGAGRNADALNVLNRWRVEIPASDLGLALALAGRPDEGVGILTDAVRGGEATAKARQNLAYAYALNGRWAEARVVASQDVPADQIDARMVEWASRARPELYQMRIATLLGAPMRTDAGQPAALALNGGAEQPGANATVQVAKADVPAAPAPMRELPPVAVAATAPQPAKWPIQAAETAPVVEQPVPTAKVAVAASAPVPAPASVPVSPFASQRFAQPAAPRAPKAAPVHSASVQTPARAGMVGYQGTHFVQLGAFSSLESAKRAQAIFAARHPSLKGHAMRITEAQVNGRHFFRVAAEGFGRGSAQTMCFTVRQRGGACFAYAGKVPGIPGKNPAGLMLAQR